MHNIKNKLVILGISASLAASILSGCQGNESNIDKAGSTSSIQTESSSVSSTSKQQEENTASTSSTSQNTPAETELSDMEHPKFISDGIRRLVLTKDGQELFYLAKEPADYKMDFDYWEILNPYDEIATVNTETMYGLFDILSQWDFSTAVTTEGADTGIDSSQSTIQIDFVNTTDSDTALGTQDADSTATLIIGNADGEGNYYVAIKGYESAVYKIQASLIDSVYGLEPFDYLLKIPALVNIETVDEIDITVDKKDYQMSVKDGEYFFDKKSVEKDTFTTLYQAMSGIIFESEYKDAAAAKGEEVLSITYKRSVKEAPEVTVTYKTYDGNYYSISVNGTERFLVKTEDVDALVSQIQDAF